MIDEDLEIYTYHFQRLNKFSSEYRTGKVAIFSLNHKDRAGGVF